MGFRISNVSQQLISEPFPTLFVLNLNNNKCYRIVLVISIFGHNYKHLPSILCLKVTIIYSNKRSTTFYKTFFASIDTHVKRLKSQWQHRNRFVHTNLIVVVWTFGYEFTNEVSEQYVLFNCITFNLMQCQFPSRNCTRSSYSYNISGFHILHDLWQCEPFICSELVKQHLCNLRQIDIFIIKKLWHVYGSIPVFSIERQCSHQP